MSLNNSIEKIKFSTNNNNKGEYRSKSNLKGKYNEIILLNNEKIGIKAYEEITNKPSNYAKYLVEKYKNVVNDYEKINFEKKKIKEFKKSKTLNKKNKKI